MFVRHFVGTRDLCGSRAVRQRCWSRQCLLFFSNRKTLTLRFYKICSFLNHVYILFFIQKQLEHDEYTLRKSETSL